MGRRAAWARQAPDETATAAAALGAAPGGAAARARRRAASAPPGVLRVAFGIAPDRVRSAAGLRRARGDARRAHLRGAVHLRLARAADAHPAADGGRAARGVAGFPPLRRHLATRHPVRRRPGLRRSPRELVAADYVYSIKRYYDPRWKSEHLHVFENAGLLGLAELRRRALAAHAPFDYDSEVEGLRALDRYRFSSGSPQPAPRFVHTLVQPTFAGAVAREVVERYRDDDLMAHPVGTGPFMLQDWRRGSHACWCATRAFASSASTPSRRPTTRRAGRGRAAARPAAAGDRAHRGRSSTRRSRAGSPS